MYFHRTVKRDREVGGCAGMFKVYLFFSLQLTFGMARVKGDVLDMHTKL